MTNANTEAIRLLDGGDVAGAIDLLLADTGDDETGERDALLGVALFRAERYTEAADRFGIAVAARPDRTEWGDLAASALANATAEVDVTVPPLSYFERDDLLGPPETTTLPDPPRSGLDLNLWRRVRYEVGHAVGSVGGGVFSWLTSTFGKNYRGEVWTNWYRKRTYSGILTLAYMRERLNSHNLKSTYPAGAKIAFQPDDLEPPDGVTHFRTADGSWNNLDDPKEGAAGTRFPRNVENSAIEPANDDELLTPNPRAVSLAV